jgi:hypothetical protein
LVKKFHVASVQFSAKKMKKLVLGNRIERKRRLIYSLC